MSAATHNGRISAAPALSPLRAALQEQPPPADDAAEVAVLGSCLASGTGATDGLTAEALGRAFADLAPIDFYRPQHAALWNLLRRLHAEGSPLDPVLVAAEAERMGALEAVGGRERLAELAESQEHALHLENFVAVVAARAQERRARNEVAGDLLDLFEGRLDPEGLRERQRARSAESLQADASEVRALTGAEILATAPTELPWLIRGLLPERLVLALVAEQKTGKSCLLAVLFRALLRGEPVLGCDVAPVSSILWATEEDSLSIGLMLREYGLEGVEGLHFLTREQLCAKDYVGRLAIIRAEQRRLDARVVVIDTLMEHACPEDENGNPDMHKAVSPLKALAASTGCAVVVTHHATKVSEGKKGWAKVRGGGAFGAAVDAGLFLARGKGNVRSLEYLGGRGSDWVERLDYERHEDPVGMGHRYRLERASPLRPDPVERDRDGETDARLLAEIGDSPGCSLTRLERKIGGSSARVRARLDRLALEEKIIRKREGQALKHYLPQTGPQPRPSPPPLKGGADGRGSVEADETPSTPSNPVRDAVDAVEGGADPFDGWGAAV